MLPVGDLPLFAPIAQHRILALRDDLLVVDKQALVSTSSGDATRRDDMLQRARAHLAASHDDRPYVSAPLPVERDVSGVLVIARDRSLNVPLEALRREPIARYVACVSLSPSAPPPHGCDLLMRGPRHALLRLPPCPPRADEALSTLARLRLRTADTPHRKPLHLEQLSLRVGGSPLTFSAPIPAALSAFALDPPPSQLSLAAAISDAAALRYHIMCTKMHTAVRVANDRELPVPGLAIDAYGPYAVVHLSSPEAEQHAETAFDAIASLGFTGVYAKHRPRQANTLVDTRRDDVAPALPVRGHPAPDPLVITENGDLFVTRLGDGLSTGIFLDQRRNRAILREASRDRRVLNLFAYACAFTVSAARGGASRTVSVDISRSCLAWGEDNLRQNGLHDPTRHIFVREDATRFLTAAAARGDRFDIIALDPPSFATTKHARFSVERDYPDLVARCLRILAPRGSLLACTNHRGITQRKLRGFLHEGAERAHRDVASIEDLPPPDDFPPAPGDDPHLKSAWLTLR